MKALLNGTAERTGLRQQRGLLQQGGLKPRIGWVGRFAGLLVLLASLPLLQVKANRTPEQATRLDAWILRV